MNDSNTDYNFIDQWPKLRMKKMLKLVFDEDDEYDDDDDDDDDDDEGW